MGRSQSTPSFSEAFGLQHAMQLAINTAFRSRSRICPETLAATLVEEFPAAGLSEVQVLAAVLHAAEDAQVTIQRSARLHRSPIAETPSAHADEARWGA